MGTRSSNRRSGAAVLIDVWIFRKNRLKWGLYWRQSTIWVVWEFCWRQFGWNISVYCDAVVSRLCERFKKNLKVLQDENGKILKLGWSQTLHNCHERLINYKSPNFLKWFTTTRQFDEYAVQTSAHKLEKKFKVQTHPDFEGGLSSP